MQNLAIDLTTTSSKIIQARIIDLTDKLIRIEQELKEVEHKMDYENRDYTWKQLNSSRKRLKSDRIEMEKLLYINKSLLNQYNEHEYQLEN
jgi:hypothetical protein